MSADIKKEIQLEIAHVLFIDIVDYSRLSSTEQRAAVDELTQIVRASEQFQKAEASERLIKIATGDGMALVFYSSALAALEKLLSIPYEGALPSGNAPLTPALLRLDPMFDPLRNDPRFQKLAAAPARK
jgi:hypothetical protein